ncbi:AraC family transcriptional regulator [Eubacterium sp.]|uniref:AraC family transcriptional regulator n=1 Tax=Eubacterium sp. TaxID=142586 RepID=UPI002FC5DDDB
MDEQILAVQRMQDYIAAHLAEDITLSDLAVAACFSPWYAHRLFRRYTGLTPAEYIRRLRLSNSALRLKSEGIRVTDVTFDLGFGSADGYTRAFHREFGCNPGSYAKSPVPITLFVPYGVKFRALRKEKIDMENVQSVFIQVMEKPARKVIIKRGKAAKDYFAYCEEVGCEVWGTLLSMDALDGEPVCLWLPEGYKTPGTSTYVQGVEVPLDDAGPIPEGFDCITLPEAQYLVFQGEPFPEEEYCEAIVAVQTAMDRYDPSVIGYTWDDTQPRIQLEPRGKRGYIEMRGVKAVG